MRTVERDVFIPRRGGLGAFVGFVAYTGDNRLWHRYSWETASDKRADWSDIFSADNGATWTDPAPVACYADEIEAGGKRKVAECCAFFDSGRKRLVTMAGRIHYPGDGEYEPGQRSSLRIVEYDADSRACLSVADTDLGLGGNLGVSFCFPIKLSTGRLLFPAFARLLDDGGRPVFYPGCWAEKCRSMVLIGECDARGDLQWRAGRPVDLDDRSIRGFDENTILELPDGRVAMIMRGSNEVIWERQPGYKWAAFSDDGGESWTKPRPMEYDDGTLAESSSTGGALFRSIKDGELYWIGNLCPEGVRANANRPRSPLYLVQVDEKTFAFRKSTRFVIDERGPGDDEALQLSNFRYYQEIPSGDVIVFLPRFGALGAERWMDADYVRYRIVL